MTNGSTHHVTRRDARIPTSQIGIVLNDDKCSLYDSDTTNTMTAISHQRATFIARHLSASFKAGPACVSTFMKRVARKEYNSFELQADEEDTLQNIMRAVRSAYGDADNCDYVVKVIESLIVFCMQFSRAKVTSDVMLAMTALLQSTTTKSISGKVITLYAKVFNGDFGDFTLQADGDFWSNLDTARDGIDFIHSIKDFPLMKKLHKFALFVLSHSLFENAGIFFDMMGYSEVEKELVKKTHSSTMGFYYCLFDSVTFILQRARCAYISKSWEPFFHSAKAFETWVDAVVEIKRKSLFLSNPEPHGFDIFQFRAELRDAIDKGETVVRCVAGVSQFERNRLKSLLNELKIIRGYDLTKDTAQKDRPAPFGILFSGKSSQGKSTIITLAFQHYAKIHGLSGASTCKYTRNCAAKHWDGFDSSKWCIVLDDIAALNPQLGQPDESLNEIICVLNNVAFVPNQAALEDKGKTPCLAKLVIATTNTPNLNAHAYFACPLAIQRRLPWVVDIMAKPECATNSMLDFGKCEVTPGKVANFWNFRVSRVVPAGESALNQRGKLEHVCDFTRTEDFLAWFSKESIRHETIQRNVKNQEADTAEIEVCCKCYHPQYDCQCLRCSGCQRVTCECDGWPCNTCGYAVCKCCYGCDDHNCECHTCRGCNNPLPCECHWNCQNSNPACVCLSANFEHQAEEWEDYGTRFLDDTSRWDRPSATITPDTSDYTIMEFVHYLLGPFYNIYDMYLNWRGGLWTRGDTVDFMYTLGVYSWVVPALLLVYIFGLPLCLIFGYHRKFQSLLLGVDWEHRFMRFIFRRFGRRLQSKYHKLLTSAKVFAGLASASAFAAWAYNRMPKAIPATVICETCGAHCPTLEDLQKKLQLAESVRQQQFAGSKEDAIRTIQELDDRCFAQGVIMPTQDLASDVRKMLAQGATRTDIIVELINKPESAFIKPTQSTPLPPMDNTAVLQTQVGVIPTPDIKQRDNVWYKNDFTLARTDVSNKTVSWKALTVEQVRNKVALNCFRVLVHHPTGEVKRTGMYALGGQMYAINAHALAGSDVWTFCVFNTPIDTGVNTKREMWVTRSQCANSNHVDLLIVNLPGLPPRAIMSDLVPTNMIDGKFRGEYILLDKNTTDVRVIPLEKIMKGEHYWHTGVMTDVYTAFSERPTEVGDCGAVMVAHTSYGPVTLGLHCLGAPDGTVKAAPIMASDIERAVTYFGVPVVQCSALNIQAPLAPQQCLGDLHYKSIFRYVEKGNAYVYGSLKGFRAHPTSSVGRTLLADAAEEFGYVQKGDKPVMNGWAPWRNATIDMLEAPDTFRQDILDSCIHHMAQDIIAGLEAKGVTRTASAVYNKFTAINGAAGVAYVDKLNRSTSAGFPWNTCKKKFLLAMPPCEGLMDPVDIPPEMHAEVDRIWQQYAGGERCNPIFKGSLKDEVRPYKKIAAAATRMFNGAPFLWSIVLRMVYLPIIKLMQEHRYVYESGPGTIAQSREWDDLYHYLTKFGENRIIAGDFKAFDKRMTSRMMLAGFKVHYIVMEHFGRTPEELCVQWGIALDIAFPHMEIFGDIAMMLSGNPSGQGFTVMTNGTCNGLYMRYAYACLNPANEVESFRRNVNLYTYGDDNVMGVSPDAPWFNHTAISQILGYHGVTYTMADKDAESVPYLNISQVSFLKRSWRWEPESQSFMCPLEHDSIEKSLMTCVASKTVSAEYQAIEIVASAVMEYFYYGREEFENRVWVLKQIVEKSGLNNFVEKHTFPTYDELMARYESYEVQYEWKTLETANQLVEQAEAVQSLPYEKTGGDGLSPTPLYSMISKTTHEVATCGSGMSGGEPRIIVPSSETLVESTNFDTVFDCIDSELFIADVQAYLDWCDEFQFQSEEVASMGTTEDAPVTEETTSVMNFLEKPGGYMAGFSAQLPPASYADATPDVSLADFLSRPVRINTFTWSEGSVPGTLVSINPWSLFFSDPAIARKLNNYAWLKCDLKLKVMVNASPFYYGAMLATYNPLPLFHPNSIVDDGTTRLLIPQSQRPHLWLYPQNNEGGEITLPFVWPKNWLSTVAASDFSAMGAFNYYVGVALTSANGVAGTGVTVTTYAWAENVVVSGPTCGLLLQADEYKVSGIASAVAAMAGKLAHIPMIRPYATATQMGASAVASVASKLGYCNVPVISDTMPYRPTGFPVMSSTEQGYPVEKLTIDPKNELCVDPSVVGLPAEDELNICSLVSRESYLCNFAWSSTNVTDDLLFSSYVVPVMFDINTLLSPNLYFTPMGWVAQMFQFWRGDIIFRFRFIASQYHRGRVRIVYDPSGSSAQNVLNTATTQTTCFNEVVDLTKDTNVEVRVPYNQALAWCRTFAPTTNGTLPWTAGSGTTFGHTPGISNGTIAIRCVTALTSPVTSSTIRCIVSVRGAENLEFAGPNEIFPLYSPFEIQSESGYENTASHSIIIGNAPSKADPARFLINHGEQVVTLRQMVRRFQYIRSLGVTGTVGQINSYSENFYRMPPAFGYDANGIHSAKGLAVPGTTFPFNWVGQSYLNWVAQCFLGYRGSVSWCVNVDAAVPIRNVSLARVTGSALVGTSSVTTSLLTASGLSGFNVVSSAISRFTGTGQAITNQLINPTVVANNPMYSAYKMNVTTPANATSSLGEDDTTRQALRLNVSYNGGAVSFFTGGLYAAAGTDWTCHFFLNVPTIRVYSTYPVVA